jgi:hypothetical protein
VVISRSPRWLSFDQLDDGMRIEAPRAQIETDGQRRGMCPEIRIVDQAFEQTDGEIVDRFPAQIFQNAQGGGFPRAQHACHQHDALTLALGGTGEQMQSRRTCR